MRKILNNFVLFLVSIFFLLTFEVHARRSNWIHCERRMTSHSESVTCCSGSQNKQTLKARNEILRSAWSSLFMFKGKCNEGKEGAGRRKTNSQFTNSMISFLEKSGRCDGEKFHMNNPTDFSFTVFPFEKEKTKLREFFSEELKGNLRVKFL